jgi:hypothetical protein
LLCRLIKPYVLIYSHKFFYKFRGRFITIRLQSSDDSFSDNFFVVTIRKILPTAVGPRKVESEQPGWCTGSPLRFDGNGSCPPISSSSGKRKTQGQRLAPTLGRSGELLSEAGRTASTNDETARNGASLMSLTLNSNCAQLQGAFRRPMPKNMGAGNKSKPQFHVRQEADRRLKFLFWLAERRQISKWQVTDWLFVAACALRARTAPHDLLLALIGFCEKTGINCNERILTAVCRRTCKAINRRHGSRWLSAKKAGGYLQVTHEERRGFYEATGTFPNLDPAGESAIAKRGRKVAERRERRRDQMRAKRHATGKLSRGQYRVKVKRKTLAPWETLGLKKWTYYRRLCAGTLVTAVAPPANSDRRPPSQPKPSTPSKQDKNPMEFLSPDTSSNRRGSYLPSESLPFLSHRATDRVAGPARESLRNPGNLDHTPSCTVLHREGGAMSTAAPRLPFPSASPDWPAIKTAWVGTDESVRSLAGRFGVTHPAILKRAEVEQWGLRPNAKGRTGARRVTASGNRAKAAGGNRAAVTASGNRPSKFPIVVRQWAKNAQHQVRVALDEYGGRPVVDVRVWYLDEARQLKPTPKGLTISIAHIGQLAEALAEAFTRAKAEGLLKEHEGGMMGKLKDAAMSGRYPQVPGHQFGSITSRRAAERMRPVARSIRGAILQELRDGGPGTPDEIASSLGRSILGVRPRFTELAAYLMGWKDVVLVEGNAELLVAFNRPATREHPFMFHCHILEHEDAGLMAQYVCQG